MRNEIMRIILFLLLGYSNVFAGECEDDLNTCLSTLSTEKTHILDTRKVVVATASTTSKRPLNLKDVEKSSYSYDGKTVRAEYKLSSSKSFQTMSISKNDFRDGCYQEYERCVANAPKKK